MRRIVGISIDEQLHEEIKAQARERNMSFSGLVRWALKSALSQEISSARLKFLKRLMLALQDRDVQPFEQRELVRDVAEDLITSMNTTAILRAADPTQTSDVEFSAMVTSFETIAVQRYKIQHL